MITQNASDALAQLNQGLSNIGGNNIISLHPAARVATRGRPPGSRNKVNTETPVRSVGRPRTVPVDPRLEDETLIAKARALPEEFKCRTMKQTLMLLRQLTKTRVRFENTPERHQKMLAMFADGKKPREVAQKMGCSIAHANLIRMEAGKRRKAS